MASPIANIGCGAAAAVVVAALVIVPTINGIETWKYVLAAIGLWLVARARREKN